MKISKPLRDTFGVAEEKYRRLAEEVKDRLLPIVESRKWFYIWRVKELESFALKVETGRFSDPSRMEDFFGCTIIVPTLDQVEEAERLVCDMFSLKERRPKNDQRTPKSAYDFRFDDLRLYVERGPVSSGKNPDLEGSVFEVQVKTILQHAWAIATHDLIYKTDSVSWPKERIAYQVKAMLEHAEIAIASADPLSNASGVAKQDDRTRSMLLVIEQVEAFWPPDALPRNRKRLAESLLDLLRVVNRSADQLRPILDNEKRRVGLLPRNLSPYSFALQALLNAPDLDFEKGFSRPNQKLFIVIQDGMEVPEWVLAHNRAVDLRQQASA